jgi:putative Holliday junction resolvase
VRNGVRIGIDVGAVRIGVARSDQSGLMAVPVETVPVPKGAKPGAVPSGTRSDVEQIVRIVTDVAALEVIVGLPRSLSGREGSAAAGVRAYAGVIARRVAPVPVRLVDERLSTVTAHQRLREAGVSGRRRRPVVDQEAAVVILQSALDAERATGRLPGSPVDPGPGPEGPSPGDDDMDGRPSQDG